MEKPNMRRFLTALPIWLFGFGGCTSPGGNEVDDVFTSLDRMLVCLRCKKDFEADPPSDRPVNCPHCGKTSNVVRCPRCSSRSASPWFGLLPCGRCSKNGRTTLIWLEQCRHCSTISTTSVGTGAADLEKLDALSCPTCSKPFGGIHVAKCPSCATKILWRGPGGHGCLKCLQEIQVPSEPANTFPCPACGAELQWPKKDGTYTCAECPKAIVVETCPKCRTRGFHLAGERSSCRTCRRQPEATNPPGAGDDSPPKGYLGLAIQDLPPEECQRLMIPVGEAVVVTEVIEGSPAAECAICVGDVIVRILDQGGDAWNGTRDTYLDWVQSKRPGTSVTITLLRNGMTLYSKTTIGQRQD